MVSQYNQPEDSKPRIKLPVTSDLLTPGVLAPDVQELRRQIVTHAVQIEKLRRDNNKLKNEIDELRNYIRTHR